MKPAHRYIIYSQVALALSTVICIMLAPGFLFSSNQGGISNYALHPATAVPFTLGFGGCALLLAAAARQLDHDKSRSSVAPGLRAVAAGYVLVLVSTYPYKYNLFFHKLHTYTSTAFAVLLLITALQFVRQSRFDKLNILAIVIIIAGFVVGSATLAGMTHLLFVSQALVGLGFGIALVHSARRLTAIRE